MHPCAVLCALLVGASGSSAQELAVAELNGRVLVADSALTRGSVVLHHVSRDAQGEIDSTAVAPDGTFRFRLPAVPDPERGDVYFASVRYAGILYFGSPVTVPIQLDSLYEIRAWDTTLVALAGAALPVQARNVFLEEQDGAWQVTDLFQVRNDTERTLVARDDGAVWRYPLPPGALDPQVAQAEFAAAGPEFEEGALVVREAIPPGERIYVVRYGSADPFLEIPMPGITEVVDVLVREPAPPLDVPGLSLLGSVELEPGTTYRRYNGGDLADATLRLLPGAGSTRFPVEWFAVAVALVLAAIGSWAVQAKARPSPAPAGAPFGRDGLILEIARLDEDFDALPSPTPEERGAYEARRRELLRRLGVKG